MNFFIFPNVCKHPGLMRNGVSVYFSSFSASSSSSSSSSSSLFSHTDYKPTGLCPVLERVHTAAGASFAPCMRRDQHVVEQGRLRKFRKLDNTSFGCCQMRGSLNAAGTTTKDECSKYTNSQIQSLARFCTVVMLVMMIMMMTMMMMNYTSRLSDLLLYFSDDGYDDDGLHQQTL